jgi:hypothetical protein
MMIDQIGNWNPQLFRELKGRLKGRNLAIATALSLLGQLIIGMALQSRFPEPKPPKATSDWSTNSAYCTGEYTYNHQFKCLPDGLGYWQIDWKDFWLDMATWSSVAILVALVLGGVYLLVNDLAKEQQRGTINFIRLSPQSSESVLLGKIIGVPVLVYFAVLLVLPLHIWSSIAAGLPINALLRFYLLAAAGCGFFYNLALLLGFLGGSAGISCLVAGLLNFPYLVIFRLMFPKDDHSLFPNFYWFSLPLGQQIELRQIFVFCNLILGTFWLWQAVNRRFRNPSATILSKRQSYSAMACFQVIFLGLLTHNRSYHYANNWMGFTIVNLLAFLVLTAAILPQRQAVQEWARYQHLQSDRRSAIREWIFGEKSPALVAIAVNLAITAIVWIPGIISLFSHKNEMEIVALFATANLIWIYATIAQVLLLLKTKKRAFLAVGVVLGTIVLPPIFAVFLASGSSSPNLWIFSIIGVGFSATQSTTFALSTIFLGFLGQVCAMGTLSWQLNRIVHKLGDSDTKLLLQERRSLKS